jgi:hypothetical protein
MTVPAGTLEALSEEPCTCHEMGPDRIGPWDCPHHGRVDAARERPGVGLREALEREHYGNLVTHTPDFGHSHPGMFSDRCGICAAKSECPSCAALEAAPVAPGPSPEAIDMVVAAGDSWREAYARDAGACLCTIHDDRGERCPNRGRICAECERVCWGAVAPGIDVERLARAITAVRREDSDFIGGLSGDSTAALIAAEYARLAQPDTDQPEPLACSTCGHSPYGWCGHECCRADQPESAPVEDR